MGYFHDRPIKPQTQHPRSAPARNPPSDSPETDPTMRSLVRDLHQVAYAEVNQLDVDYHTLRRVERKTFASLIRHVLTLPPLDDDDDE